MTPRVIVVGAGITGLAAAYRLQQRGVGVRVLESSDHVGGKTAAVRRDGFTANTGATMLSGSYASVIGLARELGLDDQIVDVTPKIGVYSNRTGRVHWIRRSRPQGIFDFLTTRLLSIRSKRLLVRFLSDAPEDIGKVEYEDPSRLVPLDDETVREYCDRNLNAELRDRLIEPLIGALYLVDGSTVSAAGLFISLSKLGGGTLGYRSGADFVSRALAERVPIDTSAEVSLVERSDRGARVVWSADGSEQEEIVDGVVLALPIPSVLSIHRGLDPEMRSRLEQLEHSTVFAIRLALKRRPKADGTLIMAPFGSLGAIGLVLFEHNISPGSAPPGKGLVGVMLYDEWVASHASLGDDELLEKVLPDLDRIMPGIAEMVEFAEVTRWRPAGLKGGPGTHRLIAELGSRVSPSDRIQLAGEYLTIPGLEGSVVSGELAAQRLGSELVADGEPGGGS